MEMTAFEWFMAAMCGFSLIVALFHKTEWLLGVDALLSTIGFLLGVGWWYAQHYMPTPYGAGVLMKFDSDAETQLTIWFLAGWLYFSMPLICYGVGAWLRKIPSWHRGRARPPI